MSFPTVSAENLMLKRGGSVNPARFSTEIFELLSIPAFDKGEPDITKGSEIGSSKSCVEPSDVLLSKIVPHIRRCWVVPQKSNYRQIASGEWIIFRDERFYPDYLKHFLTSDVFHRQFMETVAGVGGSLVRARPSAVERIKIPLPPLAEQKRIAAILDKADSLRRKNQQAIQLANQFLHALFRDMFGDPVTNPKGWEVKQLSQLCSEKMNNGIFKQNEEYGEGIPVAWVSELFGTHQITFSTKPKCLKVTSEELDKYGMYFGDMLFCRSSLKLEGIGWNNVYLGENLKALFECHLIRMRPNLNVINPIFLSFQLRYPGIRMRCFAQAKTVTMTTINQEGLGKVEVVVPNRALQDRFEIIYRKSIQVLNLLTENQNSNFLFSSLSQKAFAGEL